MPKSTSIAEKYSSNCVNYTFNTKGVLRGWRESMELPSNENKLVTNAKLWLVFYVNQKWSQFASNLHCNETIRKTGFIR